MAASASRGERLAPATDSSPSPSRFVPREPTGGADEHDDYFWDYCDEKGDSLLLRFVAQRCTLLRLVAVSVVLRRRKVAQRKRQRL